MLEQRTWKMKAEVTHRLGRVGSRNHLSQKQAMQHLVETPQSSDDQHQDPSKGSLPEVNTGCDMTPTGSTSQEEARLEKTKAQASLTNPDNTHEIKQTCSGRITKAPARLKDYFMT